MNISNKTTIPILMAIIMLLFATLPLSLPYGYYVLLKLFIFIVGVYLIFIFHKINEIYLMWLIVFISLLFNPIIPVYLIQKKIWIIIDFFVISVLIFSLLKLKNKILIDKLPEKQQQELFKKIKSWRWKRANELRVPAFFILHNRVLIEICKALPKDIDSLKRIKGMGEKKLNSYGNEIIAIIKEYLRESYKP